MLIMQPLKLRMGFQLKLKLDEEEVVKMRSEIRRSLHQIQTILREVPLCILLTLRYLLTPNRCSFEFNFNCGNDFIKFFFLNLRNLNTVRAIVHDHGNLIDRHTIMARSAIAGAYKDELRIGIKQRISAWFEIKFFDFLLL